MDFQKKETYNYDDLVAIMRILRQKCPWDREQTHASIRKNIIEEAYEVAEAIDQNDDNALCEELGDLLLQVVFHAQISSELNGFDMNDISDGICKKLILRHPHIFASTQAYTVDKVLDNWDEIKKSEKGHTTGVQTLDSVPKILPALMRSQKVQKRAAKSGLDFNSVSDALIRLEQEISELKATILEGAKIDQEQELGDVLFSAVNVSRLLKIDAEESLTRSCDKFIERYRMLERLADKQSVNIKNVPPAQLDDLWNEVKGMNNT